MWPLHPGPTVCCIYHYRFCVAPVGFDGVNVFDVRRVLVGGGDRGSSASEEICLGCSDLTVVA